MALVLTVERGKSVMVGDKKVTVERIQSSQRFTLKVDSGWADQLFEINNRMKTDVLPQVRISAGKGTTQAAKLVIDAPKHITILRSELLEDE